MNDNQSIPNLAFRSHVTSATFVLTLKPSHIKWLWRLANNEWPKWPKVERDDFSTGVQGLISRGLVEYRAERGFQPDKPRNLGKDPVSRFYRLTRAGWAVFDLLGEAGMIDRLEKRSPKRKLVA